MKNLFLNKNSIITVIGFGRFGQLLVKTLLEHSRAKIILISSKPRTHIFTEVLEDHAKEVELSNRISNKRANVVRGKKINFSHKNLEVKSVDWLKNADLIIPCVPISNFESVIKKISPLIKKGATIMDVCSVKVIPARIMKTFLPAGTQIIASHPMFGPDSYEIKKQLRGFKIVLWNISAKEKNYKQIKKFFSDLGLLTIELSPENHDKFIAMSLGYSYMIGKISQRMDIKKTSIDTYDFRLLLDHLSIIKKDSEQLFFDMQTKNPYARSMLLRLKKTLNNLLHELNFTKL